MAQHASVFTWRNDLRQNPAKHYFVVNVRYSQSTILTLRSQAGIIGGMDKQRTIRLSEQDMQAIAAIREQYGLTSDSEAIRFALHTIWREINRERNPTQALNKERHSHPTP